MAKDSTKEKKGFTIIEVVLVLAIAGLIFLMVFVAFPALQRSRNDSQRRQDYADLASNIMNEAGNTNGKVLTTNTTLDATKYVNSEGEDPSGASYTVTLTKGVPQNVKTPEVGNIQVYYEKVSCGDDGVTPTNDDGAAIRSFVVYGFMEGGNGAYCVANDY